MQLLLVDVDCIANYTLNNSCWLETDILGTSGRSTKSSPLGGMIHVHLIYSKLC